MKGKFRFVSSVSGVFKRCCFLFPTIRVFTSIMIRFSAMDVSCSKQPRMKDLNKHGANNQRNRGSTADSAPEPEEAAFWVLNLALEIPIP